MFLKRTFLKKTNALSIILIFSLSFGSLFLAPIKIYAQDPAVTSKCPNSPDISIEDILDEAIGDTVEEIENVLIDPITGEITGIVDEVTGNIIDPLTGAIIWLADEAGNLIDPITGEIIGIIDEVTGVVTNPITGEEIAQYITAAAEIAIQKLEELFAEYAKKYSDIMGESTAAMIDLIMASFANMELLCEGLANAATAIPIFGIALSTAILLICPKIIKKILIALAAALRGTIITPHIQTVTSPRFDSYKWEIGLPGLVKPGQVIKF